MIAAVPSEQSAPSEVGHRQVAEQRRINVFQPNGRLAYRATDAQARTLVRNKVAKEHRSPSGILRTLTLYRNWRFPELEAQFRWAARMSLGTIVMQARRLTS